MAQEIHIHDDNAHFWADETFVDGEPKGKGYVERDLTQYPRSMLPAFAPPSEITVYDQADWGRIADEMVQSQSRLSDVRNRGNGGKRIPSLDQGQVGYCWAHSPTSASTLVRATNNQKYVALSAYAIAATIKKGADEGGWCGLSAEFARTKGIPSQAMWPQGDRSYSKYQSKQEVWDNAKLHVTLEDYVDLTKDVYDQNMAFAQVITCLLNRVPCPSDFNWWSHSVCACDAVNGASQRPEYRVESGKLATLEEFERHWGMNNPVTAGMGIRIWNSWGDSWSDNGMGTLAGSKAVPDGAVAIRVMPFANE